MKATFVVGIIGGMLAISGSYAADSAVHLKQVRGLVLVSQGDGFRTAAENMGLERGDRVMVMDNGAVSLVYPNGCQTEYLGSQIVTVDPAKCKGGKTTQVSPMYTDIGSAGAAEAGTVHGATGVIPAGTGAGGAGVGAGAGASVGAGVSTGLGTSALAGGTIAGVSTGVVVAGAAVAGVTTAVVANSNSGGSSPVISGH